MASSGGTVVAYPALPGDRTRGFWLHGIEIDIGVGPNPAIEHEIFQSIRYVAGTPDTPAAGVCGRIAHPDRMPTPQRLSAPLVLQHGVTILAPAAPTEQPVETAAQAWAHGGPKYSFQRYRLLLVLYSSAYPAKLTAHGLQPLDHGVFAWVVYEAPVSPRINGCGGWGVTVDNAITGTGITSSGWEPGP